MRLRSLIFGSLLTLCPLGLTARAQEQTLVPFGSSWRYLDDGAIAPPGWTTAAFDDSSWEAGPAELGYGDGGEATVIGFGPDPANKPITYYFRRSFTVGANGFASARVRLRRDDGAVVYLNGVEVGRHKLPPSSIDSGTVALRNLGLPEENWITDLDFAPTLLLTGSNLLAVEMHQASPQNADLSFDLELVAGPDPRVVRGPYLQRATPNGLVVRFDTSIPLAGRVRFGAAPDQLTGSVDGPATTEHAIELSGLTPGTRYFYSVGTPAGALLGGDSLHWFRTSPPVGASTPRRFWVIGDSGNANQWARDVLQDYQNFTGATETDAWLMLGDNAYDFGTEYEYQDSVFTAFPGLLRNTVLWPSFGNHDAGASNALAQTGPYFELFTLPAAAQAGGLASGTEAYYSFDHGNVHFLVLDSHGNSRQPGGPMMTWAQADLAQTQQDWVIAFFHHAPYCKGTHDSDDPADAGGQLIQVREWMIPALEQGGVDLVLAGHSHAYERSRLIDGHYGPSSTFGSQHVVDGGDGCTCSGSCPECPAGGNGAYVKSGAGPNAHQGTVYAVIGSSSGTSSPPIPFPHPVMVKGLREVGAMVIDVQGSRLDARWIQRGGVVRDRFTLLKGGDDDADLSPNPDDNCRYTPNAGQADTGRVLITLPDGIGDACQCGDVAHGGVIDAADAQALRAHLAGIVGSLDAAALAKCAVALAPACDLRNLVVLRRALVTAPPGIAQVCDAALP